MSEKFVTVFRFEHIITESGPYRNLFYKHNMDNGHPCTDNDTLIRSKGNPVRHAWDFHTDISKKYPDTTPRIRFGFESLIKAYSWFSRAEVQEMKDNQIELMSYSVQEDQVSFFKKQVMFNRTTALKIAA